MPNWCSNYLTLTGEEKNVNKVIKLFNKMKDRCEELGEGVYFNKNQPIDGWFFDLYTDGNIMYETKWAPNIQDLKILADKYKVNFDVDYSEPGMGIFGNCQYNYITKELDGVHLSYDDLEQFKYDEDKDNYKFRGEVYECEQDIVEILLEEKRKLR